jgi:hypothetical protein
VLSKERDERVELPLVGAAGRLAHEHVIIVERRRQNPDQGRPGQTDSTL